MTFGDAWVLRGGEVIDGTGAPSRPADLVLSEGRIAAILAPGEMADGRSLDVTGCVVTPGFVDIHTHADFSLPNYADAESMVRQGVTTMLVGNCGFSAFPIGPGDRAAMLQEATAVFGRDLDWSWSDLDGFAAVLTDRGIAPNVGTLVGHGAVRIAAMGYERRAADPHELSTMQQ